MQLVILGSGTCVPSLKRGAPANFLKIGRKNVLVDCGPGTLRQMERAGLDYKDIDMVFLTHFHTDHACELIALIQALNWTPGFTRKKELMIIGPAGLRRFYKFAFQQGTKKKLSRTFKISLKEINKKLRFDGFEVNFTTVSHYGSCGAYLFREKNKRIVFSGDCDLDRRLIKLADHCDLLLIECSFPNRMKAQGHLTSEECGLIAKQSHARRMILSHLYPAAPETRLAEARKIFKNTILAEDMMRITL